jgi:hypothetical protein
MGRTRIVKIAMIGHSYHNRTGSTKFLADLLAELGHVQSFAEETWCGGPNAWVKDFNESAFDLIVIVQAHEAFNYLSGAHPNVVFVPMYDAMLLNDGSFYWRDEFASAKILCFSRKLRQNVMSRSSWHFFSHYFPNPTSYPIATDFQSIRPFFWYRTAQINLDMVLALCRETDIERFILHNAPDPGAPPAQLASIPPNLRRLDVTTWFDDAADYRAVITACNVFFAPRRVEGIGMGFLDAMASGMCVVAPNEPTMNEYIAHGTTGLLYNYGHDIPVDLTRARELGSRARESVERGHERWCADRPAVLEFFATPTDKVTMRRSARPAIPCAAAQRTESVCVVTVCKNAVEVLETTIQSVLSQDYPKLSYVILDGVSTDGTLDIINRYADRIAFWHSKPDGGPYDAMNTAIDLCTGEWILFMNAGDTFYAPDSLSRMFARVPHDADIVFGHHVFAYAPGLEEYRVASEFSMTWGRLQKARLWYDWLSGLPGHQSTAARRSLLVRLRFNVDAFRIAADHDLLFRAYQSGAKLFNCDELLSVYVGGGISAQQYDRCKREWIAIARTYGSDAAADQLYALLEPAPSAPQETTLALEESPPVAAEAPSPTSPAAEPTPSTPQEATWIERLRTVVVPIVVDLERRVPVFGNGLRMALFPIYRLLRRRR